MSADDVLAELHIKPSMNGLVATVHGQPTGMTDIAAGIVALSGLSGLILLALAGWYVHSLGVTPSGLLLSLGALLLALALANERLGSKRITRARDLLASRFLPTKRSVTVLELTPRRLLINRTSELPRTVPITAIQRVQCSGGVLILQGEEAITVDASQNSPQAIAWLHDELSALVQDAGTPIQPPEALKRMLARSERSEKG